MIEGGADITVEGPDRKHDLRFDTRVNLNPPAVLIVAGWVQWGGKERRIPPPLLDKMRADPVLGKWLFENTLASFPE